MVPKAYSTCLVKWFRPRVTSVSIKTKIRNSLSCSCWTSAKYNWECLGCHKHLVLTPKGNQKGPQKGDTWMHSHLAQHVVKKAWGGVGGITRKSYFILKSELKILWSPHRLKHSCILNTELICFSSNTWGQFTTMHIGHGQVANCSHLGQWMYAYCLLLENVCLWVYVFVWYIYTSVSLYIFIDI